MPDAPSLPPHFSLQNYVQFFAAGGLCATLTHGGLTPIDVVKTRLQLEPAGSKRRWRRQVLWLRVFKKQAIDWVGNETQVRASRQLIYLGAASAAEVVATTLLTPLEAARIRLVSERHYARGLVGALSRLWTEGGLHGLYAGYILILFKQVPYAVGQFYTNEMMHNLVTTTISSDTLQKAGKAGEIGVQLGCGLTAGVAAAVLSHPADTLLSKINEGGGGRGSALKKLMVLAQEAGPFGLWVGLPTRILMTAILVSGQFLIYEQTKAAFGAPASIEIH
ncbi:hypothetical protein MEQU1_000145 [Malassezia equina]|uniref:Uncharacterized protein n=1 Tax=Malassezia equina TaxID=1381935 RepID=A0AAF0E979_9BASI|nr:hypothetical protein MEQU1_000145 [Malassezia equina]